jgi:ketosteroid isomerase-like protein
MEKIEAAELIKVTVLALERAALDRWGKGDPGGYLEISAPDVTYFDPYVQHCIHGIAALKAWYEPFWGKIRIDRDEIIDPHVQVIGDVAILTIQYTSHGSEGAKRWNCTEVYRRSGVEWKIVHTHWSFAQDSGEPASSGN